MATNDAASAQTTAKTLFQKIIDRDLPGKFVHEDEQCVVIEDINPTAPVHLLVIPRKPLPRLVDAEPEDQALLGHLLLTANKVATEKGYGDAFRVVVCNGADAGQSVFHLHLHVIAGRGFSWPPG